MQAKKSAGGLIRVCDNACAIRGENAGWSFFQNLIILDRFLHLASPRSPARASQRDIDGICLDFPALPAWALLYHPIIALILKIASSSLEYLGRGLANPARQVFALE
jgi:hypothetical protein